MVIKLIDAKGYYKGHLPSRVGRGERGDRGFKPPAFRT